jgi:hypothetical protein
MRTRRTRRAARSSNRAPPPVPIVRFRNVRFRGAGFRIVGPADATLPPAGATGRTSCLFLPIARPGRSRHNPRQ